MSLNATPSTAFKNPAQTWNSRFEQEEYVFGTEPNDWLREHAHFLPANSRVLSVADGEGRNSVWLAGAGHHVDAFDISDIGVCKARLLARSKGVSVNFCVADCENFAWQTAIYDGVAAIFIQFAEPQLRNRLFENIQRCLKPGGLLILHGYTPKQLEYKTGGPSVLSHLYTQDLLRESFVGMDIQIMREYEADLHEGAGHLGHSALIGMVASRRSE